MTHQEVADGEDPIVDAWDDLPDADDPALAPTVPTQEQIQRWAEEGGLT